MPERVPPFHPLTRQEELVASLIGHGYKATEVAVMLQCSLRTIRSHADRIALKLPGNLPAQARIAVWWRGASEDLLTGATLRDET